MLNVLQHGVHNAAMRHPKLDSPSIHLLFSRGRDDNGRDSHTVLFFDAHTFPSAFLFIKMAI
jgi:hypothetical protein